MSEHYYSKTPQSAHKPAHLHLTYRSHSLTFQTDSGVFSRFEIDKGSQILLDSLPDSISGEVLDAGCGYGVIGIAVGKAYPCSVTLLDINERAVQLADANSRLNGIMASTLQSNGFAGLPDGRLFDWILQNPPIRAGKAAMYQMFMDTIKCLRGTGEFWLVIRKQQGAPSAMVYLQTLYNSVEIITKERGYWVLRCHQPGKV